LFRLKLNAIRSIVGSASAGGSEFILVASAILQPISWQNFPGDESAQETADLAALPRRSPSFCR